MPSRPLLLIAGCVLAAQCAHRPSDLPTSRTAARCAPPDVCVSVHHETPPGAACGGTVCDVARHWLIGLQVGAVGPAAPTDWLRTDEVAPALKKAAAAFPSRVVHGVPISAATLSMRVPAAATYGLVHGLVSAAAEAGFARLAFAVVDSSGGEERSLALPLPEAFGDEDRIEVWMGLRRDAVAGCVREVMGIDGPIDRIALDRRIDRSARGDAAIRTVVRACRPERSDAPELVAVLDPASDVAVQSFVDLVDSLRVEGVERIEIWGKLRSR